MATLQSKVTSIERRLGELEETMEVLGDKKTMQSIARGLKDLREGRFHRYDDVSELLKGIKHA
jgi:predicted nucleic acid-binding OB-fold protein